MSASASLAFPGGRTLAAWRRQLASHHPQGLWVGYLTFHRVDAAVVVLRPRHLPPLELLTLKALAARAGASPADLCDWLHLDAAWIRRVLLHLSGEGLVTWRDDTAMLTDAGQRGLAHGEHLKAARQRRALYFWHPDWMTPPAAHFVHMPHADRIAWLAGPPVTFDIDALKACACQDPQWKRRHLFPADIREVVLPSNDSQGPAWDDVIVATPQRWFAAVVRTSTDAGTMLVGFAVNSRNWELHAAQPAFTMPEEPPGWFPPPVSEQALGHAFVEWCQQREFVASDCGLRVEGDRLIVNGPSDWRE
ncbi:MAG TPA: MarR family winged helix-turn-helix transcriptional regulator, partial [Gemmataceae bacterium]|nr:MarR family winged helix-turn-helix transcriptional regulator [Gemmataceae bacterium]